MDPEPQPPTPISHRPTRPPRLTNLKNHLFLLTSVTLGLSLFLIDILTPQSHLHPTPTTQHADAHIPSAWKDSGICIPPLPAYLTRIPITSLPASLTAQLESAKERLRARLDAYAATSNDTIVISAVHSSSSTPPNGRDGNHAGDELFFWGRGLVKLNTSRPPTNPLDFDTLNANSGEYVSKDSIFRIASLTKVFTVLQGLILQDQRSTPQDGNSQVKRLTMEDDIRVHLPEFTLPQPFTNEHITLNMLGGHTSGLARDISAGGVNFTNKHGGSGILEYVPWDYHNHDPVRAQGNQQVLGSLNFRSMETGNMKRGGDDIARISAPGKCRFMQGGDEEGEWHMCTKDELFRLVRETRLIWLPGEMVSYSNTGFDVLGWALQNFASSMNGGTEGEEESYLLLRKLLDRDVLKPLGMNSSFFHPIPEHLKSKMTVPRSNHMVDLDFGETYDPAGGMYSTASDLNTFLLSILSPDPTILKPPTLRNWLKPSFPLPNGLSSVGIPWEIESRQYPSSLLTPGPVYQLYDKGGALPGHYSHISLIPELGYGVVALVAIGSEEGDIQKGLVKESSPSFLSNIVHDELVAPLRDAYQSYLRELYVGMYIQHLPAQPVQPNSTSAQGKAVISFDPKGFLVLESLITASNISLLAYLDSLNPSAPNTYASGGRLWPSGIEREFRVRGGRGPETRPGKTSCREWFAFDEATTNDGWGVDKILIRKYEVNSEHGNAVPGSDSMSGGWELVYEPLGVVFRKSIT